MGTASHKYATTFSKEIAEGVKRSRKVLQQLALDGLRREIDTMVPLVRQVMKQTRARIFRGEMRFEGKLFSLFEPSTEIIRKGKAAKPNEFGKMVKLQEAENQIIIDYEVYARRPNDSDLLIAAVETHQAMLGRTPPEMAHWMRGPHQRGQATARAQPLPLQGRCAGMKRWVGLGVIADNLLNIGRAMSRRCRMLVEPRRAEPN